MRFACVLIMMKQTIDRVQSVNKIEFDNILCCLNGEGQLNINRCLIRII